jgi:hypothetical protein
MNDDMIVEVVGADKLVAKFENYSAKLHTELKRTMEYIVQYLAEYCRTNKLSGQVLHRRTGTLSRSIRGTVDDQTSRIIGTVTSRSKGNSPLEYAGFWELGFQGQENVRAHMRRNANGGMSSVREHVRNVNQAARPFLKPTRDENVGFVQEQMRAVLTKVNQ